MAKSSIEKALEKQQREQKKLAEQNARRQQANAIVSGQPMVGDMRIMDAASEEILRIILDIYDGNESRKVHSSGNKIPEAYSRSLQLEFEKLKMYGAISDYVTGKIVCKPYPCGMIPFARILFTVSCHVVYL